MKRPDSENRYLASRQEYMEQTGSLVKAMHQWRLASIIQAVALIILSAGFVAVALQHRVVPYAVAFNEHSEVVRVGRADVLAHPTTNQTRASLRNWIIGARTVYGDRRALQAQLDLTYAMTLPDSAAFKSLTTFHRENNPYARSQKEAVEVAVNSVMPLTDETWRIEWTETTKQANGQVLDTKIWQGSFTVVIVPPADDSQILINPLGVYVKQFTWAIRQL
jgi:type IV secretion system protein VirB5